MAINGLWKPSQMGGLLGWRHDPLLWTFSTPAIDVLQRCNLWREMDFLRRARIPSLSGSGLNPSWCFELLTSYWSHTSVACSKACCTVYCSYIAVVCMFDYSLFAMLAQLENTKRVLHHPCIQSYPAVVDSSWENLGLGLRKLAWDDRV
jgi:hypothetical protein